MKKINRMDCKILFMRKLKGGVFFFFRGVSVLFSG